ncbi:hypothetical protein OZX73_08565 [Bifidobacterium sp. ESL0775]|uniref:hypothetical protein n=1 Tax=Bifidobacterium sp. ESL0775 TaxID=2983230 RepID=UPI0023F8434F|nr:hypothetical protein [Bifidobacterium sp. ESL0775]WEV69293.1 hypothetical protein OZX73_08565 [Bifidobacterium sp. ESL0775]
MNDGNGKTKTMKMKKNEKSRWWLLTVPLTDGDGHERTVADLEAMLEDMKWAGQREKGSKSTAKNPTGYPHYQVFVHTDSPLAWTTMKNRLKKHGGNDVFFEAIPATPKDKRQTWQYVHKPETRVESIPDTHGLTALDVADQSGKRNDLRDISDEIRGGRTVDDILLDPELGPKLAHVMVWARDLEATVRREKLKELTESDRPLKVYYVWGPSGIGKSWWVHHIVAADDLYVLPRPVSGRVKWDGYTDQSTVVIDEFRAGINLTDLNQWTDPYPLSLPARYHDARAAYTRVIIISNWPPDGFYCGDETEHETWMRRVRAHTIHVETREDLAAITFDEPSPSDFELTS